MTDTLLTAPEVADRLGTTVNTLAIWRHRGTGPRYVKMGRAVRYDSADLERWIAANKVTPSRST